jgi:hypothetical protein
MNTSCQFLGASNPQVMLIYMPATFPYLEAFTNVKNKRDRVIQLFTQKRAEMTQTAHFCSFLRDLHNTYY